MRIYEIAERRLLRRDPLPVSALTLGEVGGSDSDSAKIVDPKRQSHVIGVIGQDRERDREVALLHVGFDVFSRDEDSCAVGIVEYAREVLLCDPRHTKAKSTVAKRFAGTWTKGAVEEHLGSLGDDEIVFREDSWELSLEHGGRKAGPVEREVDPYLWPHGDSALSLVRRLLPQGRDGLAASI